MSQGNSEPDVFVQGDVAHDTADAGNPVLLGGRGVNHAATPTPVDSADRVRWLFNRHGIPFVLGGHPQIKCGVFSVTTSKSQNAIIAAQGTNTRIVVTQCHVTLDGSDTNIVAVAVGFGVGATVQATQAYGRILSHSGLTAGGGIVVGDGSGIIGIGGKNESLDITCDAPSNGMLVGFTYFTIAEA